MSNEQSILKTLAYFDNFHRPLTKEEMYQYLWQPPNDFSFDGFQETVERMKMHGTVGFRDGYYFLPGKDSVGKHQAAVWLVEKKMKIAVRAARKMRYVPFVRAVFVCNTVAMGSPRQESDVDVFIVVQNGRLWLTRLLITILLTLFGIRRSHNHVADHVCLSFYHTDTSLSLESLALPEGDIYLVYWLSQLIPLYDPDNVAQRMQKENAWAVAFAPNAFQPYQLLRPWVVEETPLTRLAKSVGLLCSGKFGDWCERLSKRLQTWKMEKNMSSVQREPDTRVVVSDTMLKFHENDRREYYRERWIDMCRKLEIRN